MNIKRTKLARGRAPSNADGAGTGAGARSDSHSLPVVSDRVAGFVASPWGRTLLTDGLTPDQLKFSYLNKILGISQLQIPKVLGWTNRHGATVRKQCDRPKVRKVLAESGLLASTGGMFPVPCNGSFRTIFFMQEHITGDGPQRLENTLIVETEKRIFMFTSVEITDEAVSAAAESFQPASGIQWHSTKWVLEFVRDRLTNDARAKAEAAERERIENELTDSARIEEEGQCSARMGVLNDSIVGARTKIKLAVAEHVKAHGSVDNIRTLASFVRSPITTLETELEQMLDERQSVGWRLGVLREVIGYRAGLLRAQAAQEQGGKIENDVHNSLVKIGGKLAAANCDGTGMFSDITDPTERQLLTAAAFHSWRLAAYLKQRATPNTVQEK